MNNNHYKGFSVDSEAVLKMIDRIATFLEIPQKALPEVVSEVPDIDPFPVEYDYLTRCLHRLGSNFRYYRLIDTNDATLASAVSYSVSGLKGKEAKKLDLVDPQEICDKIGINFMIVGPDETQHRVYVENNGDKKIKEVNRSYAIIYQSYDDMFYPVESLAQTRMAKTCRIFYRQDNNILQQWLPKSLE